MLTNNKLVELPSSILKCRDLELIRLADNRLSALPEGMLAMPKLSWMGLAGNPILTATAAASAPRWVGPDELIVHEVLSPKNCDVTCQDGETWDDTVFEVGGGLVPRGGATHGGCPHMRRPARSLGHLCLGILGSCRWGRPRARTKSSLMLPHKVYV